MSRGARTPVSAFAAVLAGVFLGCKEAPEDVYEDLDCPPSLPGWSEPAIRIEDDFGDELPESVDFTAPAFGGGHVWRSGTPQPDGGFLVKGGFAIFFLPDGRGWFRMEAAGPWYAAGPGSRMEFTDPTRFVATNVRRLPSCAEGIPTGAFATYCSDTTDQRCEHGLFWTVDGVTTRHLPEQVTRLPDGDGFVMSTYAQAPPELGHLLVLPTSNPDGGAAYCVRDVTRLEWSTGLELELRDIVRLGRWDECKPVEGFVAGVLCY